VRSEGMPAYPSRPDTSSMQLRTARVETRVRRKLCSEMIESNRRRFDMDKAGVLPYNWHLSSILWNFRPNEPVLEGGLDQ